MGSICKNAENVEEGTNLYVNLPFSLPHLTLWLQAAGITLHMSENDAEETSTSTVAKIDGRVWRICLCSVEPGELQQ